MTVTPRIVFTRFASRMSPKLQPWVSHTRRLLSVDGIIVRPEDDGAAEGALIWQLISGNNRQLARSARVYGSFKRAVDDAQALITRGASLEVALVSENMRGVYGWYASLDGVPVVTSARWYQTDRDRSRSISLVIPTLETAVLHSGSRLMDPSLMHGTG